MTLLAGWLLGIAPAVSFFLATSLAALLAHHREAISAAIVEWEARAAERRIADSNRWHEEARRMQEGCFGPIEMTSNSLKETLDAIITDDSDDDFYRIAKAVFHWSDQ